MSQSEVGSHTCLKSVSPCNAASKDSRLQMLTTLASQSLKGEMLKGHSVRVHAEADVLEKLRTCGLGTRGSKKRAKARSEKEGPQDAPPKFIDITLEEAYFLQSSLQCLQVQLLSSHPPRAHVHECIHIHSVISQIRELENKLECTSGCLCQLPLGLCRLCLKSKRNRSRKTQVMMLKLSQKIAQHCL